MTACKHLCNTVEDRIGGKFPQNKAVESAVISITGMMPYQSASCVAELLHNTPLHNANFSRALTAELDRTQIEFAISIFNNWAAVSTCEIKRLGPPIPAVLAGGLGQ